VNPSSPAKTVQEFIDWVKSKPGQLNYGSVGVGSSGHMMTELFLKRAGLKMTHVPFTSGPLPPLAQNQIQLQFGPIPSTIPWVKDGRLRAIGVTSKDPDPTVPDLPTVSKTIPGFETFEWPGLVAPAGTPKEVIDKLQREVAAVLTEPEVKKKLAELGSTPVGDKPEEFAAFIKKEIATWDEIGRDLGMKK
jgi:tripartite-type tricarboxylate transporter receptor subunit TctC